MAISIRYCSSWGYESRAASVAAAVRQELGLPATISPGDRGEFTVWSDGALVFSKADQNRFPDPAEIVASLRQDW